MPNDGAGRLEYYTTEQLAAVIILLSGYAPLVGLPDSILDAIAWAAEVLRKAGEEVS